MGLYEEPAIYLLADNFFRCWYRFVSVNASAIDSGRMMKTYPQNSQENIMNLGSSGGIDIGQLFQNATNGLSQDGQALQAKMDQISASGEVDQMQLLELQFAMGQYNAKLETISSVTKSIQDMLKSLAQRTG